MARLCLCLTISSPYYEKQKQGVKDPAKDPAAHLWEMCNSNIKDPAVGQQTLQNQLLLLSETKAANTMEAELLAV